MPDLAERESYEKRLLKAMREVFASAYKVLSQGLAAVNAAIKKALKKYAGPILEEIQRRAVIFLLLFLQDDDYVSSRVGESGKSWESIKRNASKKAKQSANDQLDRLGDQIADTNEGIFDEWDEESGESFEDFATRRLFPDSRSGNVAITETTGAVGDGEYRVKDALSEIGIEITAVWVTANDDRVCPICGPMHLKPESQWVDEFPNGPPIHPRCRCYLNWYPVQ
jgi:hypothetical protein